MKDRIKDLELVSPSKELETAAMEYKAEHFAYGDTQVHGSGGLAYYSEYDEWLKHLQQIREGDSANGVQTSTFFTRRTDGKLIGCVKIHHTLTDDLKSGGHIAYGIRPTERGKGYGTKQLRLCLEYARRIGLAEVIIACDKENVASAKTAMSCGGVLVKEFEEDGVAKQHYLIHIMEKVIYVGFKGKNNFSGILAESMSQEHLLLTNSFAGLKRDIESIPQAFDKAVMFGVDKALTSGVRIERVAAKDGERIASKLDLEELRDALRTEGIESEISENPTSYLCNDAYWHMLRKLSGQAVFIHVPTVRHMDEIPQENMKSAIAKWQQS